MLGHVGACLVNESFGAYLDVFGRFGGDLVIFGKTWGQDIELS